MATRFSKIDVEEESLLEDYHVPPQKSRQHLSTVLFSAALLSIYTGLTILLTISVSHSYYYGTCQTKHNNDPLFCISFSSTGLKLLSADHELAPAHEAAFYNTVIPKIPGLEGNMGPFTGNPGEEVDLAWRQLLNGIYLYFLV
jgi:hypothetical protein